MVLGVQAAGMEVEAVAPATGEVIPGEMIPGEIIPGEMIPGEIIPGEMLMLPGMRVEAKQAAAEGRLGIRTDNMSYRYVALSVSYRSVPLNCRRCIEALWYD